MADEAVFMRKGDDLVPMVKTPYENEPLLQRALARYPSLIAGQATSGQAGRLLLVRREMPVSGAGGGTGLSLDHLFLDSTGIPVLVEVKRSSDTRGRREVVAQMLDYAANGTAYWDVGALRAQASGSAVAETATAAGAETEVASEFWDQVEDVDAFWRTVEDNLRAGRVRLIFLSDVLAPELVRIIEFLNEQMRDTEVLGIELPQYVGASGETVYGPSWSGAPHRRSSRRAG